MLQLNIKGQVTNCELRYRRDGAPVLDLEMADIASGQTVCIEHAYPDATNTSRLAASALARGLRGQHAELVAINPRFKAKRLLCEAQFIHLPHRDASASGRKDLQ